jgi:hypothetical protein
MLATNDLNHGKAFPKGGNLTQITFKVSVGTSQKTQTVSNIRKNYSVFARWKNNRSSF